MGKQPQQPPQPQQQHVQMKVNVQPQHFATLTEIAAMSTGTTQHGAVITELLTSTQCATAVLVQTMNKAFQVNVTPLIFAMMPQIAAMSTGTTQNGAVVTTLNTSTQWSTAVLVQACNQAIQVTKQPQQPPPRPQPQPQVQMKVNVTPQNFATLTEIA